MSNLQTLLAATAVGAALGAVFAPTVWLWVVTERPRKKFVWTDDATRRDIVRVYLKYIADKFDARHLGSLVVRAALVFAFVAQLLVFFATGFVEVFFSP